MSGRWQVRLDRPVAYDVLKTPDIFAPENPALLACGRAGGKRFVVVDAEVERLHGAAIRRYFDARQVKARYFIFPGGEENKSLDYWQKMLAELDAFAVHRRDEPLIAIGGGVLTDVAAYAAASHRRGVPHLKVPTTLMGYVDAALGIKCGINFNGYKNRVGAFAPPLAVLLDRAFLATLPRRHLRNGICEIIKLATVCDAGLFALLERDGAAGVTSAFQNAAGEAILDRAIGSMLAELTPNLYEEQLARPVDFGHTFSYGLEARYPDQLLHGEAVLLDILVSCLIAEARGLMTTADADRVFALVARLGIDTRADLLDGDAMWQALEDRIAHRNGLARVPLPTAIGHCTFTNEIARAEMDAVLSRLHERLQVKHEPAV